MYKDNHNDIYDNNNISNKNQLHLSLSNVKSDDWIDYKKKAIVREKKQTLGRLRSH